MSPGPERQADQRLAELFVRYWDNALTSAESNELQTLLASDSAARDSFQLLCVQAMAAAEHLRASDQQPTRPIANTAAVYRRSWSRRQLLGYIGGGVAAGIAATVLGKKLWFDEKPSDIRLTTTHGEVTLRSPNGDVSADGMVPSGGIVTTHGPSSSAVLSFPDGTEVSLTGESSVSVSEGGRKITLLRGTATAHIANQQPAKADGITLSTTEATLTPLSGVVLTIGRVLNTTEVGVQAGRVSVSDSAGDPLEVVHTGECLTVRSDGKHRKIPIEPTPDAFRWDLARPLPEGWNVGVREVAIDGPVVRPIRWFDPYHKAEMYQIRSDHQWARGFVRLTEDSAFQVKLWAERSGVIQLCMCVRTDNASNSDTGMLECNEKLNNPRPREWHTMTVRVKDMLDNKHAPKFRGTFVPFLIIFNTYREDLA